MIRRDYILRMIEEIGKMIAIILGLLKKGDVQQAQNLYREGVKRAFGMDEEAVLAMDVDELRVTFENQFGESFEGLEVVAGLLVRGGDIHIVNNCHSQAQRCYLKALHLYNLIEMESGIFSLSRQAEISKVTQLLEQLNQS